MKVKLSDAFDLQMGKTPPRNDCDCWGVGHKWISISDIGNTGKYIDTTKEEITDIGVSKSSIKVVPKGTVIMSFKLSIGKTAITAEDMYTNEAIMAFINKGKYEINTDYLYHLCKGIDWFEGTNKAVLGLTLNKATMSEKIIEIPPMEVQLHVVSVLDKMDELIALRKEQLAKLDQLAKSRFIELFGDLKINSKLWCECKIDEACSMIVDCVNKTAPTVEEKTPYKMIRTTNIKRGRIDTENVRFVEKEIFDKWTRRAVPQMGDIILTREAPMGEVGMIATDESVFLGQRLVLYRVNPNRMNATYLMHLIMSDYFQEQVAYKGKGSTVKHLPVPDCTEFNVLIPNIELQEQFATFVEQIDKSKLTIQQSLDKLELLKKSLMQEYFG